MIPARLGSVFKEFTPELTAGCVPTAGETGNCPPVRSAAKGSPAIRVPTAGCVPTAGETGICAPVRSAAKGSSDNRSVRLEVSSPVELSASVAASEAGAT